MPVKIEPNSEPIPGYRLIERLGGGGFGEVWKAEAPGGLFKAIKFVYGDLQAADDREGFRAEQELKALSRVKTVHHPYILSLDRFDIVDGQLMIVMELADRTLWDRFRECRQQGLPGIPREELLGYMQEAAEALDLMNNQFQLQHLDIKPQNLFLCFNHVKVADFGLVKDLGTRAAATITGGVTPVYAAPETFDGWLSRFSDQYSLAIVYQELLTGQRPFAGATMRQLILQHLQSRPDLASLPAVERPIVEKALAKDPDERFPTCIELVQRLRAAGASPLPEQAAEDGVLPGRPSDPQAGASVLTRDVRGQMPSPVRPEPDDGDDDLGIARPKMLPPRPETKAEHNDGDTPVNLPDEQIGSGEHTMTAVRLRAAAVAPDDESAGPVQPAVVIGLGTLGLNVVKQLRGQLNSAGGDIPELELATIRLLGIDTDQEMIQAVTTGELVNGLGPAEVALARLHRPTHYIKVRDGKIATDSWLNSRLIYRIPRDQNGAGLRPLGRLAFVDNFRLISRRLEAELRACCEGPPGPDGAPTPPRRPPRVYIVTGLGGNTGSGMYLDVAYVARHLLRRFGYGTVDVVGVFIVPPANGSPAALSNAFAALVELSHYGRSYFKARYDSAEGQTATRTMTETAPPFQRCVLLPAPEAGKGTSEENGKRLAVTAAEYLFRELATPLGRAADDARRQPAITAAPANDAGPTAQAFGVYRLVWPRRPLLERCGRRLCERLVERWMNKDARPLADVLRQWASERWDAIGMRPENLIARHQELCDKALKQAPDRILAAILAPLAPAPAAKGAPAGGINVGPVVQALAQFEKLMGIPDECRPTGQSASELGKFENALADACGLIGDECEQRVAELAVRLIEDPNYRLAGAEEALRQFSKIVEQALASQEILANELHERAVLHYQRIQHLLEHPAPTTQSPASGGWKLPFGRKAGAQEDAYANDVLELLKQYAKARYHSLLLHQINRLYVSLRGHLSDQLREVGYCRQRLGELAGLLKPAGPEPALEKSRRDVQTLLPGGCRTLDEVIERVETNVTPADVIELDKLVQALIRQHYHALVQVCMGASNVVRALAPAMVRVAEKFLEPRFQGTSVADLFLRQKADGSDPGADAGKDLERFYEEAMPQLVTPTDGGNEIALAVVPDDERGKELQALIADRLPHVRVLPSGQWDELIFYRERVLPAVPPSDHLGPAAREAYRQRLAADASAVHCREDVTEWQPAAPAHAPR
jgi:serine/threonine protein kinase